MSAMIIKSREANDLKLTAYHGHFATRHSHNSHYLDITRMKHECAMADIAAASLANHYVYEKEIDTVVCLDGSEVIGNRTRAKIVKNKVAPPFREAEFDIMYGEGISKYGELVDLAVKLDIIHKSGSWFSMGDERIGQGRENARQYLRDHPELADRIEKIVREEAMAAASNNAAEPPAAAASEEEDPDLALMDEIEE